MAETVYTTGQSVVCVDENGKTLWQMNVVEVAEMREDNKRYRSALVKARQQIDMDGVTMRLINDSFVSVYFNDRERRELAGAIESNLAVTELVGKVIYAPRLPGLVGQQKG